MADENQHPVVIARLREAGFQVEWLVESSPGASDISILSRSDIGQSILLTYDRDFGELIFKHGLAAPHAIIYTRLSRLDPEQIADRMIAALEAGLRAGHLTTLTKDGARSRPFPGGASNG